MTKPAAAVNVAFLVARAREFNRFAIRCAAAGDWRLANTYRIGRQISIQRARAAAQEARLHV